MATENNKSVNIISIAEKLGISKTTVGYVLSGEAKKRRVADKTANRVIEAAQKMNYVPHMWARNLARQKTGAVGLVIGGYEYDWAGDVMGGAMPAFEADGYTPITSIHLWEPQRNEKELRLSLERRDEGIICQPLPECKEMYEYIVGHGVPLVFIADTFEEMPDVSYVAWDSVPAVKAAVGHLIKTGRKHIGFIGSSLITTFFVRQRYEAYRQTLEDAGVHCDEQCVRWSGLYDWVGTASHDVHPHVENLSVERTIQSMLETCKGLDAIFFPHDSLALAAYKAIKKMGVRVPEDIAVMGMGDVPLADDFACGLSTVREPLGEIGTAAAEAVLELIRNPGKRKVIQRLICGNELKIRRTT